MKQKNIYFLLFLFILLACNNKANKNTEIQVMEDIEDAKDLLSDTATIQNYVFIPINRNTQKAIEVAYDDDVEPDTMYVNLFNEDLIITRDGEIYKNDLLVFELELEEFFAIEKLFFIPIEKDELVAIYTDTDMDCSGSVVQRISLKSNKILWSVNFGGFNMAPPVYIDDCVYLSTIGVLAKLNYLTGKFDWKFEDLYDKGKYNSFGFPHFYENDIVLFTSKKYDSPVPDSIFIDEKLKKIIKKQ